MWRTTAVLIQDKASGQSLIQDLQQSTAPPIIAEPAQGRKSKWEGKLL
jgi:phage terminase large subunit-like protein